MLNPILASSALRRMRSARTLVIVGIYVLVLMAIVLASMHPFLGGGPLRIGDMSDGLGAYQLALLAQFALILLIAPAMTASSIAGERDRQTLELLLVTNTSSLRIVMGKLMESFAFMTLLILSGLPVMSLAMLTGGVGIGSIVKGMLFLLACAFAASSVGVLCSSFMKNVVGATIVSYVLLLMIGAGTIIPLIVGISDELGDLLYDPAWYAALTPNDAMGRMPPLLYVNPGVGLFALLNEQAAFLQNGLGRGRIPALLMLMEKIGHGRIVLINMGLMVCAALGLDGLAALMVRPGRVRVRRRK